MKPRKLFVQECYAGTYRLHRSHEAPVLGPIRAKHLSNKHDAMAFIRRLRMGHADGLRLLHHRRIRFYRFDELTYDFDSTDNHYPVINTTPGVSYHFVPSSILLLSDPNLEDINSFTTYEWQQAEQFLDTLALTDDQLDTLIPGLKLQFGRKARPGPTRKERLDCLFSNAIFSDIFYIVIASSAHNEAKMIRSCRIL